jgi:hypothetical protein
MEHTYTSVVLGNVKDMQGHQAGWHKNVRSIQVAEGLLYPKKTRHITKTLLNPEIFTF